LHPFRRKGRGEIYRDILGAMRREIFGAGDTRSLKKVLADML
jgi:hypothetical protein